MNDPCRDRAKGRERLHRGDIMSAETRSRVMSRIRGRGTKPEKALEMALRECGLEFETHARDLPGRPDFVFRDERVAVFVDGDFWHGYRFADWRLKLSEHWEAKIAANRQRDRRNTRELRAVGWTVVRIWEHEVTDDPRRCALRVRRATRRAQAPDA